MSDLGIYLFVGVAAAALLLVAMYSAFYKRASKDRAYVRTGLGGECVIVNDGALVFPVLHDLVAVNMQTLRVEISRSNNVALITQDPLRVDVVAEFFLRVGEKPESISTAARTLGDQTLNPEKVKEIVEAQCVAALRSVASKMTLDELHVKRTDFESNVENTVNKEFEKNGLELVSVSLMRLDQTSREYFDENNAFDARGLIKLDEITEESKKRRNDIEQDNKIKIQEKNKQAEQQRLMIQQQEIESQKNQEKYIADLQSRTAKEIEEIKINRERELEEIKITRDRELEEIRISKDVAIEMAQQDMEVLRAQFMKNVTEAWMVTDKIKAEAARLTEEISTAREKAEAERAKLLEIIGAQKEAQRQTIIAEANAEVERLAAKAAEIRYQVEAVGKSAMNQASNLLNSEQISMQVKLEIVRQLPSIIRESVKPIENIDGIRIMHLDGLGAASGGGKGGGSGANGSGNNGGGGLADQVVDSALRYRAQVPLIDSLLREVDLKGDSSNGLTEYIREQIISAEKAEGKAGDKGKGKADDKPDSPPPPRRRRSDPDDEVSMDE